MANNTTTQTQAKSTPTADVAHPDRTVPDIHRLKNISKAGDELLDQIAG